MSRKPTTAIVILFLTLIFAALWGYWVGLYETHNAKSNWGNTSKMYPLELRAELERRKIELDIKRLEFEVLDFEASEIILRGPATSSLGEMQKKYEAAKKEYENLISDHKIFLEATKVRMQEIIRQEKSQKPEKE